MQVSIECQMSIKFQLRLLFEGVDQHSTMDALLAMTTKVDFTGSKVLSTHETHGPTILTISGCFSS